MADKDAYQAAQLEEDELRCGLAPWQEAWLIRHREELVRRIPTIEIIDRLIARQALDPGGDVYQNIRACHEEKRNERARLLLDYIASQNAKVFWDFQDSLSLFHCGHLAVQREDEQIVSRNFSAKERSAVVRRKKEQPPVSVFKVIEKLKKRYRKRKILSLDCQVGRKSVQGLKPNICLLNTIKLETTSSYLGQRQPFRMSSLKENQPFVIDLEDLFIEDEHGEIPEMQVASGIAGSGKTTAFTKKAPYEWSDEDRERPFWKNISLFFEGTLTEIEWWEATTLAELFGLASFDLTKQEEDEVVRFIRSHAEEVLLVADSMDEATVKTGSLLWRVLTGTCKAVEGLKIIICSRPCEMTAWLTKNCPFDRHLEVVGFTDEKVGQFVDCYFGFDAQKALALRAHLVKQPAVFSLMHTPLLATMFCHQFGLHGALPCTKTEVYQEVAVALLEQSSARSNESAPGTSMQTSPAAELQAAASNLTRLSYEALTQTTFIFTTSKLKTEGCLDYTEKLGLLSASPGDRIPGTRDSLYSFPHHTMLENFAAVHAAIKLIGAGEKSINDVVKQVGTDGNLTAFWIFFSGLLDSDQCELLLSALGGRLLQSQLISEISRLTLLLLECYTECKDKQQSAVIAEIMKSRGLDLRGAYVGGSTAHVLCTVIKRYRSELCSIDLSSTIVNCENLSQIITSLEECENLHMLNLPEIASIPTTVSSVCTIVEKNASTLAWLSMPAGDESIEAASRSVRRCSNLHSLVVGSRHLTKAGAALVAGIIRHQQGLRLFGVSGTLDDDDFETIACELRNMSKRLDTLNLYSLELTAAVITGMLCSLKHLHSLGLYGVPIGDAGLQRLAECRSIPTGLYLYNVGLTVSSLSSLEKLVANMPDHGQCQLALNCSLFPSTEDVIDILRPTSLRLVTRKSFSCSTMFSSYGLRLKEQLTYTYSRGKRMIVFL